MQPVWGQHFVAAAELPLGAELYVSAGNTSDLVAGAYTNRLFNGANSTVFAKMLSIFAVSVAPAILSQASAPGIRWPKSGSGPRPNGSKFQRWQ